MKSDYSDRLLEAEEFDFLPRDTAGGGAYAIPGNVAGFALLQSTHGRLPWQRVVSPAESLAATGFPISQALHARLEPNQNIIRFDAELAREFLDEAGHLKPAGTIAAAPELAQTLSQIRVEGAEALYRGAIADAITGYARVQGGDITAAELSAYRAQQSAPSRIPLAGETVFFPSDRVGAGQYARAVLGRLVDARGQIIAPDRTEAAVASATKAVLDSFKVGSLPRDLGATGFAVIDSAGGAVSCAVTMDGPFGSGRTAGNSGIVLAAAPKSGSGGLSPAFLAPAIAASGDALTFAGAGAGGPNATATLARGLIDVANGEDLTQPGALGVTGLEPFETTNVISCRNGICATLADPKAFGLGVAGQ